LTEAVEEVIQLHLDKATMFEQTVRRVEERVMFGDSEAAMSIMTSFEKDELEVDDNIKNVFTEALKKLNVTNVKGKKASNASKKQK
jgi:hypothetical protein